MQMIPFGMRTSKYTATKISFTDSSGTPKNSPVTVSSAEVVLTIPANATTVTLATDNNLWLWNATGVVDATHNFTLPGGTIITFDAGNDVALYMKRGGGSDCTVSVMFTLDQEHA